MVETQEQLKEEKLKNDESVEPSESTLKRCGPKLEDICDISSGMYSSTDIEKMLSDKGFRVQDEDSHRNNDCWVDIPDPPVYRVDFEQNRGW